MTGLGTDEKFLRDLQDCIDTANQLKDVGTEDTRTFVSGQLQELQSFLQKKTHEAERLIQDKILEEEKEIESLKERIARATQSKGDESDIICTDLPQLWNTLYEDYWHAAFYAYIGETKEPVDKILDNLLLILQTSYSYCKKITNKSADEIMFQMIYPGEDSQTNKNLKIGKPDKDLVEACRKFQIRAIPFSLKTAKEVLMSDIEKDRSVTEQFKTQNRPLYRALKNYLEKCVEFCWVACFEEPEIKMVSKPGKETKALSDKLSGLNRITHRNREDAAVAAFPAIVQGDKVRIQWELYPISQPRPAPNTERLPDHDYRVIRVENKHGQEIVNDPQAKDQDDLRKNNTDEPSGSKNREQPEVAKTEKAQVQIKPVAQVQIKPVQKKYSPVKTSGSKQTNMNF